MNRICTKGIKYYSIYCIFCEWNYILTENIICNTIKLNGISVEVTPYGGVFALLEVIMRKVQFVRIGLLTLSLLILIGSSLMAWMLAVLQGV